MRRVSIGIELVAAPDVLVLDEPTSGLDSVSAARLVKLLKNLADEEKTTIVASIHQPSSALYHSFNQVVLLANGRQLYFGPGGNAPAEFFASQGRPCPAGYNIADHLLEIASGSSEGLASGPAAMLSSGTHELDGSTSSSHSGRSNGTGNANGKSAGTDSERNLMDTPMAEKSAYPPTSPVALWKEDHGREVDLATLGDDGGRSKTWWPKSHCAATFLTQIEVLSGREWKNLKRSVIFPSLFPLMVSGGAADAQGQDASRRAYCPCLHTWLVCWRTILQSQPHHRRVPESRRVALLPWLPHRFLLPVGIVQSRGSTCAFPARTSGILLFAPGVATFSRPLRCHSPSPHSDYSGRDNRLLHGGPFATCRRVLQILVDHRRVLFGNVPLRKCFSAKLEVKLRIELPAGLCLQTWRSGDPPQLTLQSLPDDLCGLLREYRADPSGAAVAPLFLYIGLHARSAECQRSWGWIADHRPSNSSKLQASSDEQDTLAGVKVSINAVIIMQTLFGFSLGNYYRCVMYPRSNHR